MYQSFNLKSKQYDFDTISCCADIESIFLNIKYNIKNKNFNLNIKKIKNTNKQKNLKKTYGITVPPRPHGGHHGITVASAIPRRSSRDRNTPILLQRSPRDHSNLHNSTESPRDYSNPRCQCWCRVTSRTANSTNVVLPGMIRNFKPYFWYILIILI